MHSWLLRKNNKIWVTSVYIKYHKLYDQKILNSKGLLKWIWHQTLLQLLLIASKNGCNSATDKITFLILWNITTYTKIFSLFCKPRQFIFHHKTSVSHQLEQSDTILTTKLMDIINRHLIPQYLLSWLVWSCILCH